MSNEKDELFGNDSDVHDKDDSRIQADYYLQISDELLKDYLGAMGSDGYVARLTSLSQLVEDPDFDIIKDKNLISFQELLKDTDTQSILINAYWNLLEEHQKLCENSWSNWFFRQNHPGAHARLSHIIK